MFKVSKSFINSRWRGRARMASSGHDEGTLVSRPSEGHVKVVVREEGTWWRSIKHTEQNMCPQDSRRGQR